VVALFCHRALNGIPWTVYKGYHRTFMFHRDFTPTLANALEQAESGSVYNIGGIDYRAVEEVSEIILNETGADPDLVTYLPEDVHNVKSKKPDNTRANIDLDHFPTVTINEGIPKTLDWMRGRSVGAMLRFKPRSPRSWESAKAIRASVDARDRE
jgi:dTDP-glucose 4,6-dehydratase